MKKMFMAVIALMMTISASAQFYLYCSDGKVIKVDSISMIAPADEPDTPVEPEEPDTPTEPEEPTNPSEGIGVFSVSADKKVTFSPGNLQYTQSTNTWSFASAQWEMLGTNNVTGGSVSSDPTYGYSICGEALADKVDLFGWSTSATNFGVNTSTSYSDYSGSFIDWGTNKIGNDAPNTWRTLTTDEWEYLRNNRTNANDLVGVAQVYGVNGLIFLPDNWTCPAGVTFKSGFHSNLSAEYYAAYQTFTADQWSKMESAGAIFLPVAGFRNGTPVDFVQCYGRYWSATEFDSDRAFCHHFYSGGARMSGSYRNYGQSVRLVKDVEGGGATPDTPDTPDTPTEPEEPTNSSAGIGTFSVSADKQVTFSKGNLQYHPANNVWQFAEKQTDYIGDANSNCSSTYNGWLDLFGWSTSTTNFGVSTSSSSNDYSGSFVDWGTNQIGSDAPNTWRTLSKDEWIYIFYNRPNAQSLFALGSVNGVNGTIILPDNWTTPAGVSFVASTTKGLYWDGLYYYNSNGNNFSHNIYTSEQWSKMEQAGAVFLPASGARTGSYVGNVQNIGYYWSATEYDELIAYDVCLDSSYLNPQNIFRRYNGFSVRLVKDIEGGGATPDTPDTPDTPTEPEESENTENGYEYVDLGLSVKWATCNVGASTPEEYGDYFAWGETEPKDYYHWSTYKWCNGSYNTLTKYNYSSFDGTVDDKNILEAADDAATANWGGNWRMPTDTELTELRENCTWTQTTQEGVNGYKVTSKKNGNTIFLPAAGYCEGRTPSIHVNNIGNYWTSSLNTLGNPVYGLGLYFTLDTIGNRGYATRTYGLSVRPVCP